MPRKQVYKTHFDSTIFLYKKVYLINILLLVLDTTPRSHPSQRPCCSST
jgi:hypothetical protein